MKSVITAGMMGVLMVGALAKSDLTRSHPKTLLIRITIQPS